MGPGQESDAGRWLCFLSIDWATEQSATSVDWRQIMLLVCGNYLAVCVLLLLNFPSSCAKCWPGTMVYGQSTLFIMVMGTMVTLRHY